MERSTPKSRGTDNGSSLGAMLFSLVVTSVCSTGRGEGGRGGGGRGGRGGVHHGVRGGAGTRQGRVGHRGLGTSDRINQNPIRPKPNGNDCINTIFSVRYWLVHLLCVHSVSLVQLAENIVEEECQRRIIF